ncbi:hypothetical protein ABPG74_012435 [Tetrahymena malaccensis]
MNSICFSNYNVDAILSTEKNTNKRNLVKVNDKYYFQIPNEFEETLECDDEANYKENIQIEKNGSYAKILSLDDLYDICQYFQLKHEITAVLIFQFLKFEQISENFVHFLQDKEIDNVIGFIQKYNRCLLQNMLRPLNRYHDAFQTYSQYLANYNIFHKSLVNVCVLPVNIQRIQELILKGKPNEVTEEEREKFINWVELLDFQIITSNTIFNECYNLERDDVWTVQRVQQHLDESINNLQIDEYYIERIKNKDPFQKFFLYERNHLKNLTFPQITKEKQEKKCIVEMRLKNKKYRLAIKSQSCEFLQTLFYKNEIQMNFNSKITNYVKNELENLNITKYYVFLDLKDFCLNVDYDVVENLINMPKLANYLRQRKVFYVDPVTKKEEQLILKKGIIIGEVYHNYILTCISDILLGIVKETFAEKLKYLHPSLDYSNYFDDFLIEINLHKSIDQSEFVNLIETALKDLELKLNKIGFNINKKKLQMLSNCFGKINAWEINDQFQFKPCESFVIFDQDLLKDNQNEEQSLEQIRIEHFLKKLSSKFDNNLLHKAKIDQLSKLEQYFTVKFLKMSNLVNYQNKKAIIQHISKQHQQNDLFSELNRNNDYI